MKKQVSKYPKVSVIIPTYNRANMIKNSIESVLAQTYKNFEIIVVDDSNDETESIVKAIVDDRLIYLKNNERKGVSRARNMAIKIAKGELIAFQDSDDTWYPDKLEKQVNLLLNSNDNVAAIYCATELFDVGSGKVFKIDKQNDDFKNDFIAGSHLPHTPPTQTILVKKSVLNEIGYFDERLNAMEDTELTMRISKQYDYKYIAKPLIRVARNHNSLMSNVKNYIQAKEILLEKHNDFLSKRILYGFCKAIGNYYILREEYKKALVYIRKSFGYHFNIKTFIQYLGLKYFPFLIRLAYKKKYNKGIPHPNFKGKFIKDADVNDY